MRVIIGIVIGFVFGIWAFNNYVDRIGAGQCVDDAYSAYRKAHP